MVDRINAQIETRETPCTLCGMTDFKKTYALYGYHLGACIGCGLWRLNPQPTPEALEAYYQRDYYAARQAIERVGLATIMRLSSGKLPAFRESLADIRRLTDGRKLLDVGCAYGQYCLVAGEAGFDAEGIELDPLVAQRGQSFGLDVRAGDFLRDNAASMAYDAITFWYVLEHVTDPLAYLQKAHQLLGEGGILYLRVPNMGFGKFFLYLNAGVGLKKLPSIISHIPAHLFFYTPYSLSKLTQKAGFTAVNVKIGQPIYSNRSDRTSRTGDFLRRATLHAAEGGVRVSRGKLYLAPYISLYAKKG